MSEQIKWEYGLREEPCRVKNGYVEFFETAYEGKPVVVDVWSSRDPLRDGGLRMLVYSDNTKKVGEGILSASPVERLVGIVDESVIFIRVSREDKKYLQQPCGWPQETPNLEAWIEKYRPLFESQGDLRKRFLSEEDFIRA